MSVVCTGLLSGSLSLIYASWDDTSEMQHFFLNLFSIKGNGWVFRGR